MASSGRSKDCGSRQTRAAIFAYLIYDIGLFSSYGVLHGVSTSVLFPEAQINVCGIPFHDHLAASLRYANRVIRTHTGHLQTHLFPQQHEMKQECKGKMRGANGSRRVSVGLCVPCRVTCGAEVRHAARSQRARPCHFVH